MFTKLFSSLTTSSIWNESNDTRILWITMLAMADRMGYVAASVGGLAHEARLPRGACEKALEVLSSPDEDSRSKEFEGRRIRIVDGGFQIINYPKYRKMRSEEERREYMREYMKEYREKCKQSVNNVSENKPGLANAEESRGDKRRGESLRVGGLLHQRALASQFNNKQPDASFDAFWEAFPKKVGCGAAQEAWKNLRPSLELCGAILAAVETQKSSNDWKKDEGKYIPSPAKWLSEQRWRDDLTFKKTSDSKAVNGF